MGLRPGAPAPIRGPPGPLAPAPFGRSALRFCAAARAGLRPSARLRRRPRFLRSSRPAAPLRCARPLRRAAPARARPCAVPPLPRSASCALPRSVGARCRRLPAAPAALRCGLPVRSPLLRLALGLVQRVGTRGLRLGPSGLRPRSLRPGPRCGAARRFSPFGGRGLVVLAGPARLRCAAVRVLCLPWGSPLRPPAPPPPLGAPGCAMPVGGFAPAARVALLAPLLRAPRRAAPAPGAPIRRG